MITAFIAYEENGTELIPLNNWKSRKIYISISNTHFKKNGFLIFFYFLNLFYLFIYFYLFFLLVGG